MHLVKDSDTLNPPPPPKIFEVVIGDNQKIEVVAQSYYVYDYAYVFVDVPNIVVQQYSLKGRLHELPPVAEFSRECVMFVNVKGLARTVEPAKKKRGRPRKNKSLTD